MSLGTVIASRWRITKLYGAWSGESMDGRELYREDELNIGDTFTLACMSFPVTAAMLFADVRFMRHCALAITSPLLYAFFSLGDGMSHERALLPCSVIFILNLEYCSTLATQKCQFTTFHESDECSRAKHVQQLE